MNLERKKLLAKKVLGVGKERIVFIPSRIDEIKEAITRQDILDLKKEGAIMVKPIKGKNRDKKRKSRSVGNVRKNPNKRKRNYVIMTRKLRAHISGLKKQGKLSKEEFHSLRKKIRNKDFKSKAHLKENIKELEK